MRKFMITVNGAAYEVEVEEIGGAQRVAPAPAAPVAPAAPAAPVAPSAPKAPVAPVSGGAKVTAPMPGTILSVNVQVGQTVKSGDVLLILEAMKMENEILAPENAKVLQVAVTKGATVNTGDVLIVLG